MPELPEVEVTRLSFAQRIAGAHIQQLCLGKALRWPLGVAPAHLQGLQVLRVRRRGKYLLLDLSAGMLLLHLGMSGSLRFAQQLPPPSAHEHMDLHTSHGILRLRDPRRFGAVVYAPLGEADPIAQKLLGNLGVEPLSPDFTPAVLHAGLRGKNASIKQALLGGRVVVGVGNIYASEALFIAGIRPQTAAGRISLARAARLHAAIVQVLRQALAVGGSTLKDFANTDGEPGYFALHAAVYGRAALPCRVCQRPIVHIVQGQRSSFYCPHCQRA
jgi:formamidopyrimidine-DNA glycosylase